MVLGNFPSGLSTFISIVALASPDSLQPQPS